MTITFNDQELIQSHRINDLSPFYEMLAPTYAKEPVHVKTVYRWADIIRKKNIPFAITKANNVSGVECVYFWVQGKKKFVEKD